MHRRTTVVALTATALAAGGAGTAAVAKTAKPAPRNATIKALDGTKYKINRFAAQKLRFSKDVTTIRSGGTITVVNRSRQEPHTLSFVKRSQLPNTARKINACSEAFGNPRATGVCADLIKAHAPDPQTQLPKNLVVNVGKPGADRPGDSFFVAPGGHGPQTTFKVTAPKGTTLHYFCLVHPWMQAVIKVK